MNGRGDWIIKRGAWAQPSGGESNKTGVSVVVGGEM